MLLTEGNALEGKWECVSCPRTFILKGNPTERIVLQQGDETASHFGSHGVDASLSLQVSRNG